MSQSRSIFRRSSYARNEIQDVIQSVFVAECLQPSHDLWLVSPWISDIEVIQDAAGAFASLVGDLAGSALTLSAALVRLAERGAGVHVVTRKGESQEFVNALERRSAYASPSIRLRVCEVDTLHAKGLVGDDYRIWGSMNFTFSGVQINDESIQFDRDPQAVTQMRLEFERHYGVTNA